MKKTLLILPLVALTLMLAGCGEKPLVEVNSPTNINVNQPADDTMPEDETLPSDEENVPDKGDETTDGTDTGTDETEGGIKLPDLKVDLPDMKIVVPSDDEEDDSTLPTITPQLDIKVTQPKLDPITPPVPDPNPGI